ncbi:MAG TPA: glycerol-3-phosphate 1-O-acyltransferase PlsY [Chthoniobacterales bacterium]|nr:glycerol-3-phosphate 1-O-acyltransferase PlsY [Chthoniobacterales bacterium]
MLTLLALVLAEAYLLGSIPNGYIAGRLAGVDVRQHGSGNIGATNVLRTLGKSWGFAVFLADVLKGFLAVRLAIAIVSRTPGALEYTEFYAIVAAAACVAGHSFPVWLRFKGGKGVATSAGSLAGVMPIAAFTIFLVWLAIFKVTRYVSIASIVAASALPVVVAVLVGMKQTQGTVLFYFSLLMTVLVVWRHRSNISRLLNGTEPRFARK